MLSILISLRSIFAELNIVKNSKILPFLNKCRPVFNYYQPIQVDGKDMYEIVDVKEE